ncbi:bifunctional helix-turn-helix transcriptional regulator/GNAT family N-acetyltransferase [Couchioplanes caeruleus]|uniref:GNAT family N-acetyltransferase n=2 Tax=Couchioplanes caeruleus TaxID=56438 RepID=A0A1K0GG43_9ACTN|nr:bifunctional helix-turn-helix transcriptional regulator/GNAT family N-acetyltransferase [Couchioplanes caeruleus]OJF11142.1 GNAT family N-acetyltransferase [Couchioplanes caeruleus subsp. caeruleus]ROP30917.1 MarR family transcriptional regulator with acetyltransferase activity [Couchioplanes caeruleus]
MDQAELVLEFNRNYTRRIGDLTDRYLGQRRPLGEARLLFEIGAGAEVRDLRMRLGLDSGYLSRLLHSLEAEGLVEVAARPDDRRVRVAELTDAGVLELADLDARSREAVDALLNPLTPEQRERLIAAQEQVWRLLRLAAVDIQRLDDASGIARECLLTYAAELEDRFPEGYDASTLTPPGQLALLVAWEDGGAVGCVAWRRLGPKTAEVRHLWVGRRARGIGLGRRLLQEIEADAAAHGFTTIRLGTHRALTEAIELYRSSGYREIEPYDGSPYNQMAFEKGAA